MTQPTFSQVFGTGAIRLASGATTPSSGLFIPDSAFQSVGLTPSTATAEGHLIALLLNSKNNLTQTNFNNDTDFSVVVTDGFSSLTTRGTDNTPYRTDQLTVSFSKVDNAATVDPDDY